MNNGSTVRAGYPDTPEAIELSPAEFQARLRWARVRGHPLYLWPDVHPEEWRAALGEIERVTRALLLDQHAPHLSGKVVSLRALGVAALTSGMGPLLGWWIQQGRLEADTAQRALLATHLEHGRERATRMHQTLRTAVDVMARAGVPVIVLKGAHTAWTLFPEPGTRPMADLDLLVPRTDTGKAEAALAGAHFQAIPGSRLKWPYRSDWRPPGTSTNVQSLSLQHRDNPYTVDLHAALDIDFFGVRTVQLPFPTTEQLVAAPWAGPAASALPPSSAIAYQAAHAARGLYNLTLIRLVELTLLLRSDSAPMDWTELTGLLRHARAQRFVYPAFELVERLVPGTVDTTLRACLQQEATPALRGVLNGLTPATAQRLERVALNEQFMWAATPVEHARRALHMLLPGGGSWRRLLRIYLERVFRLLRGRIGLRK